MIHTTKKGKQTTDANTKRERTKLCQLTEKEKRTTESRKSIDEKMRKKTKNGRTVKCKRNHAQ